MRVQIVVDIVFVVVIVIRVLIKSHVVLIVLPELILVLVVLLLMLIRRIRISDTLAPSLFLPERGDGREGSGNLSGGVLECMFGVTMLVVIVWA